MKSTINPQVHPLESSPETFLQTHPGPSQKEDANLEEPYETPFQAFIDLSQEQ